MGRPPKPTRLHVIEGTWRRDRHDRAEPVPAELPVRPPRGMSPAARRLWKELAPDRERAGVLTAWDVHAFAAFCEALVILRTAHTEPASVWRTAVLVTDRLGSRFGWTPADRARLAMHVDDGDEDDGDDLLTRAGR